MLDRARCRRRRAVAISGGIPGCIPLGRTAHGGRFTQGLQRRASISRPHGNLLRNAAEISAAIREQIDALGAESLLLAASPAMLRHVRKDCEGLGVPVTERQKDLTKLSASELTPYLLKRDLLSPAPPSAGASRAT